MGGDSPVSSGKGSDTAVADLTRDCNAAEAAGQRRALQTICGDDGIVVGVAADHRDALRAALARRGIEDASVADLKVMITAALAPHATVMLLDAEQGAPAAIHAGVLPRATALVMPLEAQGYGQLHAVETTTLAAGWSPRAAGVAGAAGCKLLLPLRTDHARQARRQLEVVRAVSRDCTEAGVAFVLEPIVYQQPAEQVSPDQFAKLVVAGACLLAHEGATVLKMQYPGSSEACASLTEACGSVPWLLLGGGESFETLVRQVEHACEAGASGFIVGRTLWDSMLDHLGDDPRALLERQSVPQLQRLAQSARTLGRSALG